MRYMLLICSDKNQPAPSPAQMDAMVQGHGRFAQELRAAGKMVHGERLRPDTDGSRVRFKAGQRQIMDGPFTETKEALGGFYLIECDTSRKPWSGRRRSRSARAASSTCDRSGRCESGGSPPPRRGPGGPDRSMIATWRTISIRGSDRAAPTPDERVRARLAEVFRIEHARVVASVLRIVRDIDAAQEVVQEAFEQALAHWPADGVPDRPGAWLLTTARRRALDHLRRARRAGARVDALAHDGARRGASAA